jgi:S1-C subfamily serine protease
MILLAVLASAFTACVPSSYEERHSAYATRLVERKREASIAEWQSRQIRGQDAVGYANNRTYVVIRGDTTVSLSKTSQTQKVSKGEFDVKARSAFDVGSVTAISHDGYFLTAAHCVDEGPLTVILLGETLKPITSSARVVWSGRKGGPDLALIHAPVKPYAYFPMLPLEGISPGTPILTSGFGGAKQSKSAGKITRVKAPRALPSGAKWLEFNHNAPLLQGDSGGPVVDTGGWFLGLNSTGGIQYIPMIGHPWIRSYQSKSFSPDPEWIRSLIREDREKRRGR